MDKIGLFLFGLLAPVIAKAEKIEPIKSNKSLEDIINGVIDWILTFVGALAVLFIVIGGIRYIISAGNPDQAGAAKKTILYAVIGLVIVLLSYVIKNVTVTGVTTFF